MIAILALSGWYLFREIESDWVPHDEGTLAQSAERVLDGELPHVDFDDPYTGGLSFFNAGIFRFLGPSLSALRIPLLFLSLGFFVAVFLIASRMIGPTVAAGITLMSLAWSVPNYPSAMPSWYNLFLAGFGSLALLSASESGRWQHLVLAGLCGGLSIAVKSTGVYFVLAAITFLVFTGQLRAAQGPYTRARVLARALVLTLLLGIVALCLTLLLQVPRPENFLHFAVPPTVVVGLLVYNEIRMPGRSAALNLGLLCRDISLLILGVAIPILGLAVPFLAARGIPDLFRGVFLLPRARFWISQAPPPGFPYLATALPLVFLWILPRWSHRAFVRWTSSLVYAALAIVLFCFGDHPAVYRWVWASARLSIPVATVVGVARLAFAVDVTPAPSQRVAFLCFAMAAFTTLVQFPLSYGVYFCYVAPFAVLATAAVAHLHRHPPRGLLLFCAAGLLGFAVRWLHPASTYHLGFRYVSTPMQELHLERAGLRVPAWDVAPYEWVVNEVRRRSEPGDYIYAMPDVPEVYFLSERRNPTGTFSDCFDADFFADPARRTQRILGTIEDHDVNVVVLKRQAEFTKALDPELVSAIRHRFPHSVSSESFAVLWREDRDGAATTPSSNERRPLR